MISSRPLHVVGQQARSRKKEKKKTHSLSLSVLTVLSLSPLSFLAFYNNVVQVRVLLYNTASRE